MTEHLLDSRREWLQRISTLVVGAALIPFASCRQAPSTVGGAVNGFPIEGGAAAAKRLGVAYLSQTRAKREAVASLVEPIIEVVNHAANESTAVARLREAVIEDFKRGRTVLLSGWLLSQTEVAVCVLLAEAA